ncbi:MAG: arginase [Ktedonobacterales bacterium]
MRIGLISVPMDLGADRRGVDMGASAIRYTNLDEKLRALGHEVINLDPVAVSEPETRSPGEPRLKYLEQIVAASEQLAMRVKACLDDGAIPVTLGGDHSVALGSISGAAGVYKRLGVIWIDAHADFNTDETSPSGNIHGMILAALAGLGDSRLVNVGGAGPHVSPQRIAIVGAREIDPDEQRLLREQHVHVWTMSDIDRRGMEAVFSDALRVATDDADGLHVSFDLDAVDPTEAPGVGTPVPGGITYREAQLAMEMVAESGKLTSLDMVEVNPILDRENRTAILACELALSAFGKRIF